MDGPAWLPGGCQLRSWPRMRWAGLQSVLSGRVDVESSRRVNLASV